MTDEQTPNLGVTPDNREWLAETFGHEPVVLEHDWDDLTLSLARATLAAVRAVPNDVASAPLDRGLEGGRIARHISESLDLGSRLGPTVLYGAQNLLNRAGLSSERRAIADAVLNMLHVAGGPAQFEGSTIRRVVRRQTQAWHNQGWTPRTITRACAAGVVGRPRPRGARPTRARAFARSSSRSGDSGDDGPGEPPSDLAVPCCCEQCGNELLLPARLCGLCEEEAGLRRETRACVICGTDISDRRADAETCGAAHKKTLQRLRAQLREPARLVPQRLDHDGSNPLAGVPSEILACVYQNGTSSPPRHVVPRPWRGERGEVIRVDGPAIEPPAPVVDLPSLRLARRHARFVNALAAAAQRRMVDMTELFMAGIGAQVERQLQDGRTFVLEAPTTVPALWGEESDVLWSQGESLIVTGPQGVGKSTLVQQLALARAGVTDPTLIGFPVKAELGRVVLYIAADRPRQIARSFRRMVTEQHADALERRLKVWKGPLPFDLVAEPQRLAMLAHALEAGTVVIDSLKDVAYPLTQDDVGSAVNRAIGTLIAADIEVVVIHHQRKATSDNKKPSTLADVYGSTWITSGSGSVISLWGEAGDPFVELVHLKQPADDLGPIEIEHDHDLGTTRLRERQDAWTVLQDAGSEGTTAHDAAIEIYGRKATRSQLEKVRRKLQRLADKGLATPSRGSGKNDPIVFRAVSSNGRVYPPCTPNVYPHARYTQVHEPPETLTTWGTRTPIVPPSPIGRGRNVYPSRQKK